jgi:Uma2 family endonuclease
MTTDAWPDHLLDLEEWDALPEDTRQQPADVLAVVEVLSPGTRRTDRVAKTAEYAEAGIAHYALLEPGPPVVLTTMRLVGGRYEVTGEHRGPARADLGVETSLDLDALDR